jgi:DNA-binding XRE family transcriptional regulator
MSLGSVRVKNADRMMTFVKPLDSGIELEFADGCKGLIPYADIPEIATLSNLAGLELPNPYEVVLRNAQGESSEIPWAFARHYCDPTYRSRIEAVAVEGSKALGARIRRARESAGLTQEALARAASVGRVTLVRIESGEQSPRFGTLLSLSTALGAPIEEIVAPHQPQE